MIYCCPQSEWFLLGAMEDELPLFERRIAIRPYKCATTPLEGIFH